MAEVTKSLKYSQKSKWGNMIFLFIVILITIGFATYNFFLEKEIVKIEAKIQTHKTLVKELEGQKKVYVYSLLKLHKQTLAKMDERSNITKFIDHIDTMKEFYNVEMRGFNMSNGTITSKVKFTSNDTGIAYKSAVRFISDYRKDENALLDLEFISNISGSGDDMKFPVLFTLKK